MGRKLGPQRILQSGHSAVFDVFPSAEIVNQHALAHSNPAGQLIEAQIERPGIDKSFQTLIQSRFERPSRFGLSSHVPYGTRVCYDVPSGT